MVGHSCSATDALGFLASLRRARARDLGETTCQPAATVGDQVPDRAELGSDSTDQRPSSSRKIVSSWAPAHSLLAELVPGVRLLAMRGRGDQRWRRVPGRAAGFAVHSFILVSWFSAPFCPKLRHSKLPRK